MPRRLDKNREEAELNAINGASPAATHRAIWKLAKYTITLTGAIDDLIGETRKIGYWLILLTGVLVVLTVTLVVLTYILIQK